MQNYKNGVNKLANHPTNFFQGERFFQNSGSQLGAIPDVFVKHRVQFARYPFIKNKSIGFVVIPQAAAIQIGSPHCAKQIIDHHDFRVMEPAIIHIDRCPSFHQFVKFVECGVWGKWNIGSGGNHDCHIHPPINGSVKRLFD